MILTASAADGRVVVLQIVGELEEEAVADVELVSGLRRTCR